MRGYRRKNGTWVRAHDRQAPQTAEHPSDTPTVATADAAPARLPNESDTAWVQRSLIAAVPGRSTETLLDEYWRNKSWAESLADMGETALASAAVGPVWEAIKAELEKRGAL